MSGATYKDGSHAETKPEQTNDRQDPMLVCVSRPSKPKQANGRAERREEHYREAILGLSLTTIFLGEVCHCAI